ncbi:hypothetical protein BCAR13_1840040 [Paraburkholderia caribensis]|nr:hypothetical protein BCAR13_1840040 [Paraburkholderia caribensis]
MSSGNLHTADLAISLPYEVKDFGGDVALEAADNLQLEVTLADPLRHVSLVRWSVLSRPMAMMCKALFAARSPLLHR